MTVDGLLKQYLYCGNWTESAAHIQFLTVD